MEGMEGEEYFKCNWCKKWYVTITHCSILYGSWLDSLDWCCMFDVLGFHSNIFNYILIDSFLNLII